MPSLQQLRYLVAIADTKSFSRAARLTHVTQPTLSMQLRDMERRLGTRLVERNRSRVFLTPVGNEIVRRARAILNEVADIHSLAKAGAGGLTGVLRVGVVNTLGAYLLPILVPSLRETYPGLRLYVRDELPDILLDHLDEGRHDIVICPLPMLRDDFTFAPIFREPLQVVVPRSHPLAGRETIERADLKGETVLTMERGHRLFELVSQICAEAGAFVSNDYEGTSLDTLRQMVAMGMGIALLPSLYVRSEVQREELVVARSIAGDVPFRAIGIAWRKTSARSEDFERFAIAAKRILRERVSEVIMIEPPGQRGSPKT
ncbi:hydrogen peroxide-inducible genes activator [Aureimonas populi]|uniref:Hydrogen peroxide-inducible genes activator n=1 Tax=Aureimonas populi TaxID=1701758 RepID=A0ABW5CRU6_9HYPH|nr:hydrogen peroxide-inducible genes activator [Aureimonas populi]